MASRFAVGTDAQYVGLGAVTGSESHWTCLPRREGGESLLVYLRTPPFPRYPSWVQTTGTSEVRVQLSKFESFFFFFF